MPELCHDSQFIRNLVVSIVLFTYAKAINHKFLPVNVVAFYWVNKHPPCFVSAVKPIHIGKVKIREKDCFN